MSEARPAKRVAIALEKFQMDDGRDLIEEIAETLDTKGTIEFQYRHLPIKDHAYVATRAGFEHACQHHPLDAHRIVSFDLIAPQDLFKTADDVYAVLGPDAAVIPGFDVDIVFYMSQTSFARDAHALITRGNASRDEQVARLLKLLDTFPLRLFYGRDAYSLFASNDLTIQRLASRAGDLTPTDIEHCYTWLGHFDSESFHDVSGDMPRETRLDEHIAWYSRHRWSLRDR